MQTHSLRVVALRNPASWAERIGSLPPSIPHWINFRTCDRRRIRFYEIRTRSYCPRCKWIFRAVVDRCSAHYRRGTGAGRRHWRQTMGVPAVAGDGSDIGGMLATAGGLVFGTSGGSLFALDAATGKELWYVGLGGDNLCTADLVHIGRTAGDRRVGGTGNVSVWLIVTKIRSPRADGVI